MLENWMSKIGLQPATGDFKGTGLLIVPIITSILGGLIIMLWIGIAGTGFLWAIACLGAGSLMGIIFGIPRSASRQPGTSERGPELEANTNMEQISDWLTKLLVGAGLVQLSKLPGAIDSAATYIAPAVLHDSASSKSVAAAILIYFSVEGFIGGYVFTRVYFMIFLHNVAKRIREGDEPPNALATGIEVGEKTETTIASQQSLAPIDGS